MIFQKSASTLSRSSLAAKARAQNLWGSSSSQQSQPVPGFFVSTPQFTRHQQSQVAPYQDDSRGAGNSGPQSESANIGNPYLALTGGANLGPAAPAPPALEEERRDEPAGFVHRPSSKPLHLVSEIRHGPAPEPLSADQIATRDAVAEIIDESGEANVIDGIVTKMRRLQAVGSHRHVLATFETLIALREPVPVEAYNIALSSLASTADVSVLLEAYERMLSQKVRPNTETYSIVLESLVSAALELAAKRKQLEPFIGTKTGVLESVDEIIESLAVEEHLTLAIGLLQAVVVAHADDMSERLRASLHSVVSACIDHGVKVPPAVLSAAPQTLVPLIKTQPTIEAAAQIFSSLAPEIQVSESAQVAMLESYILHNEPRGAIAFFDGCGSPQGLLKHLLPGFASLGLVGTARRWVDKLQPDAAVIGAILMNVPTSDAKEHLPSATQLFYKYTSSLAGSLSGTNDGGSSGESDNGGRCAYMRLCVAAGHSEALYMALREAHMSDCLLDPVTIMEVVNYLSLKGEPILAADLFAWQFPKLSQAWLEADITSFVGQELASDTVSAFQKRDQLSLQIAIILLPYVTSSVKARESVFDILFAARLVDPSQISELVNAETLKGIVNALAVFYTRASGVSDVELERIRKVLPLFVEDALTQRCEFSEAESNIVAEALLSIENTQPLLNLWHRRHPSPMSDLKHATAKESAMIQRYALLPDGVDIAVQLLKDQLLRQRAVAPAAIDAVLHACARDNALEVISELYSLLPKTRATLNSFIVASVDCKREIALSALEALKASGVYADLGSYSALIVSSKDVAEVLALFNEVKNDAKLPLSSTIYNDAVNTLARNLRRAEAESLMTDMQRLGFEPSAATLGSIISMHVRLDEGDVALSKLKDMSLTAKSLLEVKTFNHLMHYFVHKKADRNAALEVFMELRATGTLATPFTYRLLMEAYLLLNQNETASLAKADKVLALMRHDGAPIPTMCFATLLRARGVLFKDFDGARNFYRGLVKNSRVLPDQNIFKALMESYVTNGRQAEAALVFDEMKRYHVSVNRDIAALAKSV